MHDIPCIIKNWYLILYWCDKDEKSTIIFFLSLTIMKISVKLCISSKNEWGKLRYAMSYDSSYMQIATNRTGKCFACDLSFLVWTSPRKIKALGSSLSELRSVFYTFIVLTTTKFPPWVVVVVVYCKFN